MLNKVISIFEKGLSIMLVIISIIVIYLVIYGKYINPGHKGISDKDLSQICVFFCCVYLIKYILKFFCKEN
jgi:hypothetical protein